MKKITKVFGLTALALIVKKVFNIVKKMKEENKDVEAEEKDDVVDVEK
jgi:hypothetical protein